MLNSQYILEKLDSFLTQSIPHTLHLLGGAAFDLVYDLPRFSEDVDIICTLDESKYMESQYFRDAILKTNEALEPEGLYITHIFEENGLVHTRDWTENLVPAPATAPQFKHFRNYSGR